MVIELSCYEVKRLSSYMVMKLWSYGVMELWSYGVMELWSFFRILISTHFPSLGVPVPLLGGRVRGRAWGYKVKRLLASCYHVG
tara:strand:- start:17979 stop:18230 length:252 start_codon:yes stop_codon:yes gene_type:complete